MGPRATATATAASTAAATAVVMARSRHACRSHCNQCHGRIRHNRTPDPRHHKRRQRPTRLAGRKCSGTGWETTAARAARQRGQSRRGAEPLRPPPRQCQRPTGYPLLTSWLICPRAIGNFGSPCSSCSTQPRRRRRRTPCRLRSPHPNRPAVLSPYPRSHGFGSNHRGRDCRGTRTRSLRGRRA